MPVGRFRTNPRTLDDVEQRVFAAQYPESALMAGMGIGLVVPLSVQQLAFVVPLLSATLATGFTPIVGGIVGYLLGHWYKDARIESLRNRTETDVSEPASRPVED